MIQAHGTSAALVDSLRSIPSVQVVAAGSPFAADESLGESTVVQVPRSEGLERKSAVVSSVSPEFFAALGIPILRGRVFDGGTVSVVSEALARSFWPGEDPVDRRIVLPDGTSLQVAGVARDLRSENIGATDAPHIYRFADPRLPADALMVRFAGAVEPIERQVRETMQRFDVERLTPPKTLRAILDENAERMSTIVRMVVILALIAVLLAVFGIYGIVALAASRRTREIGIRMALGATGRQW